MSEENRCRTLTHKQLGEFEEKLGFRPSGTNNFWCTYFNTNSTEREIIGEGALSIDEFVVEKVFVDFVKQYINDSNRNNVYYFSVIINSNNIINLVVLKNNPSPKQKYIAIKDAFQKYCYIFDLIYSIFIVDDGKKTNVLYRNDVKSNALFLSFKLYKQTKKEIETFLNNYKERNDIDQEQKVNTD